MIYRIVGFDNDSVGFVPLLQGAIDKNVVAFVDPVLAD